ncbi:MAG: hypothetical protein OSJ27_01905 [Candidatus Gastranaerophilales bacterium]|nr:hypothetical protein [Candidatus Gastranaerophilales bacterium]
MMKETFKTKLFNKIKSSTCGKIKEILKHLSLPAVIYAENLIGKGFGETKKQIAIDFIINSLPSFLLPLKSVIKRLLSDVLDFAVELAVEKLHSIQKNLPDTI